jgi:phage-related protein
MNSKPPGKPHEPLHSPILKTVEWVGSSKKDLAGFPKEVQKDIGTALMWAQMGGKHADAKPWKGLGPGVMEIVSDYDRDTYRAIYTVNIGEVIYVLHTFQKKSKSGISTPREEIERIQNRYKMAVELSKKRK